MNVILFLIILAALILVHEWGHFIVAKKSGIRVDEFAIGFPPRLWKKKIGETLYTINLLPIGGFVKIFGEDPNKESIEGPDKERSFVHKPKYIQALVIGAGVIMNIVFAWMLFTAAITIGLPVPGGYAGDKELKDSKVAIVAVLPESPAASAGLKQGDKILAIRSGDGEYRGNKIEEVQNFINAHGDQKVFLEIEEGTEIREVVAMPISGVVEGRAALGVSLGQVGILKLPVLESIFEAGKITIFLTGAIAIGLFDLIRTAIVGQADLSQIAGPVGIVFLVEDASNIGLAYLLGFVAMISVNLAVINLFPFPALDGGRLLFVIIESIIRRPIKPVVANATNFVGLALLMIFVIVITYNDIVRHF